MKDLNGNSQNDYGHSICGTSTDGRDSSNGQNDSWNGPCGKIRTNRRMGRNSIFPNIRGGVHKKLCYGFSLLPKNDLRSRQAECQIHEKSLRHLAGKLERLHEFSLDTQGHENTYRVFESDYFNIKYWFKRQGYFSPHGIQRGKGFGSESNGTSQEKRFGIKTG